MAVRRQSKKKKQMSVTTAAFVLVVMIAFVVGGMVSTSDDPSNAAPSAPPEVSDRFSLAASDVATAKDELASLQVADKGTMDTYDREAQFGEAWTDDAVDVPFAGNGCDTRNDILDRDLSDVVKDGECTVESGRLWNPYGVEDNPYEHYIDFVRGRSTSSAVQIDHVVALGNVWVSGGDRLTQEQRVAVANDPINLIAVDGPVNGAKGDRDAADWLPPNDQIHCFYAASQVQVKAKYQLTVTQPEQEALGRLIDQCPAGV